MLIMELNRAILGIKYLFTWPFYYNIDAEVKINIGLWSDVLYESELLWYVLRYT